jgi:hypothetical protein
MKTLTVLFVAIVTLVGISTQPLAAQERMGYVMRVEGRLVFLDLGAQDEVIPNDLFRVIRQETIIHPVTGENLGGEVPLGIIRIVEIFPRYSTAEILNTDPGADIRMMSSEARQGLIRVKMLTSDEQMDVQNMITRKPMIRSATIMAPSTGNPDGAMNSIVPEFRVGGASAADTNLPSRTYNLISNPVLLAQADTASIDQTLENFNSPLLVELGVRMPLSDKASFIGRLGIGAATKFAVGARFYPGTMFGSGVATPDGHVGEPAFTVMVGYGGKGSSALPAAALAQLTARTNLVAVDGFEIDLGDTLVTVPVGGFTPTDAALQVRVDSAFQAVTTDSIRASATDSLTKLASTGLGFGIGVDLPLTEQIKLDASLERFGSIETMAFGLAWYSKRMGMGDANPDGVLRSLIGSARLILDSNADKTYVDLGITYPVSAQYTLSAGFISDFGGFSQFGLAVRGYINRQ